MNFSARPSRVVFGSVALALLLVLASPFSAAAQTETLYLSMSQQEVEVPLDGDDDNITTKIYAVDLDDESGVATLREIAVSRFNQADALACNQSDRCYLFDRFLEGHPEFDDGGFVEEYDVSLPEPILISESKLTEDTLGFPAPVQGVVLASFHPDGTLYVAAQDDDRLYTIDLDLENNLQSPTADVVGVTGAILVDGVPLDVEGADLAFTANHRAFLWTNGATEGLYELFLPVEGQTILEDTTAVQLEEAMGVPIPDFATGLAVRGSGLGNLVLSTTLDEIVEHSLQGGTELGDFVMMEGGVPVDHGSGDMANTFANFVRCRIDDPFVFAGQTVNIDVEIYYNGAAAIDQEVTLEVLDSDGNLRLTRMSRPFSFVQGDRLAETVGLKTPPAAPEDDYTARITLPASPGDASAECEFTVFNKGGLDGDWQ